MNHILKTKFFLTSIEQPSHAQSYIPTHICSRHRIMTIKEVSFPYPTPTQSLVNVNQLLWFHTYPAYTGWPRNNGTVDTVDFSGLCSNQQLFSSLCWIEHLFSIIITPRSSNLVENFLFYETFFMDCHFRDLPDFQSFEARWQINGKSQKWQSIGNYS